MDDPSSVAKTKRMRLVAWASASAVWLLGCLILGVGCFVIAGHQLRILSDPFWAAVYWQICFAVGLAVILATILGTQHVHQTSLTEMGWRRPPSITAIIFGVALGLLYVSGVYAGMLNDPTMKEVNPFAMHWVRFVLMPLGVFMAIAEEAMMRGFFMTQLARARVPVWAQIILSGACSGVYHSFHNLTWIGFVPSFILFTLHALLYVTSRRSLLPSIVAHSMYHALCAPYLLMFAMNQSAA